MSHRIGKNTESEKKTTAEKKRVFYPTNPHFKKIVAIIFVIIVVSAMIGLAMGKVSPIHFWITVIFCAIFAWLILPKMR